MINPVDTILSMMSSLNHDELERVRKTALLLSKGKKASDKEFNRTAIIESQGHQVAVEVISEYLRSRGIQYVTAKRITASAVYRNNSDKIDHVLDWMSQVKRSLQKRSLMYFGVELLHEYLSRGVPMRWDTAEKRLIKARIHEISFNEVLIFFDYIPVVIENQFPGYQRAGLLNKLIPTN